VGKSTIINSLLGTERLRISEVKRNKSRGRHTTTFSELLFIPGGGMVIDTPGIRELQVWGDKEGLKQVFTDIEELSLKCRFRDCTHQREPECAVQSAIQDGILDRERLQSYLKLKREYAYLADRQTMKAAAVEKMRWKAVKKEARRFFKERN
jgi:ribosome biogenesis GTPase